MKIQALDLDREEINFKSKPISLCVFSYCKRYYLTHPWAWFKDLWVGIKNFWHRGRYGYAWVDLWNMDTYLNELIPNMLHNLAARSHGWPEGPDFPDMEDWIDALNEVATALELINFDYICDEDKWAEIKSKIPEKYAPTTSTAKYKFERLNEEINEVREKCFAFLVKNWGVLWD